MPKFQVCKIFCSNRYCSHSVLEEYESKATALARAVEIQKGDRETYPGYVVYHGGRYVGDGEGRVNPEYA